MSKLSERPTFDQVTTLLERMLMKDTPLTLDWWMSQRRTTM